MAETGWPLIPREVLPAPVPPAVKAARRSPAAPTDAGRQLSIFGAETTEPSPFDLAALLAGPGRLGRMGGTARVSVRVDAAWRVHVLVAELVARGLVVNWRPYFEDQDPEAGVRSDNSPEAAEAPTLKVDGSANLNHTAEPQPEFDRTEPDPAEPDPAEPDPTEPDPTEPDDTEFGATDITPDADETNATSADADESNNGSDTDDSGAGDTAAGDQVQPVAAPVMFEVRTAYSSRLKALANAWPTAADQLFLTGPRLRLWVAAAGRPTAGGYALGLDPDYSASNKEAAGAALRRAGLEGVLSNGDSHYLIMGRRRLARLAELVGERPAAAPAELWPGAATA